MKLALQVDEILEQFTRKTLTKIAGEPTLETILKLEEEVQKNAATITTTLGGGNHVHLGIVMGGNEYTALTGTPFAVPQNPGYQPIFGAGITTAAQREQVTN